MDVAMSDEKNFQKQNSLLSLELDSYDHKNCFLQSDRHVWDHIWSRVIIVVALTCSTQDSTHFRLKNTENSLQIKRNIEHEQQQPVDSYNQFKFRWVYCFNNHKTSSRRFIVCLQSVEDEN